MNKDILQYDCLVYMRHIGVEVVAMEDIDRLFRKYGGHGNGLEGRKLQRDDCQGLF